MTTSTQIKSLIRSHFEDDRERFITVALQIAAHEAKAGHVSVAREIRDYVDQAKRLDALLPGAQIKGDLSELLLQARPGVRMSDLIVRDELRNQIGRILNEYRNRAKLKKHGMANRRRLLLAGPPGTGKTMTASVIGGELHLALHIILMHKMVTKYMGETSAKLRQIFDIIDQQPGIYLFDEFDAIGTQRGLEHEVGEMRRVLNSFLQFIEQDASDSLIIAATNTFDVLDPALFRRFDDVLYYELPDANEREKLIRNRLSRFASEKMDFEGLAASAEKLSHAEITRACDDAIKQVLLSDETRVTNELLESMLAHRKDIYKRRHG